MPLYPNPATIYLTLGAAPTAREYLDGSRYYNVSTSFNLVTASGTEAGDLLVLCQGHDYGTLAEVPTPTGTSGAWTRVIAEDNGTNKSKLTVWTRPVTVAGAQTVTVSQGNADAEFWASLSVWPAGTVVEDYGSSSTVSTSTSAVAPSVDSLGANHTLLCAWLSEWTSGSVGGYTVPGTMTLRTQEHIDSPNNDSGAALTTGTQTIAVAGATGTRTATISPAQGYLAASVLLRTVADADRIADSVVTDALAAVPSLEELQADRAIGAVSGTATHLLGTAMTNQRVSAFSLVGTGGISASNSDYWTVDLKRYRAGSAATMATRTTQVSAPNGAVTANTAWTFDLVSFDADQYLQAEDVLAVVFTATGSPTAWAGAVASWRYEPGVTA